MTALHIPAFMSKQSTSLASFPKEYIWSSNEPGMRNHNRHCDQGRASPTWHSPIFVEERKGQEVYFRKLLV